MLPIVILAGGKGSRMGEVGKLIPKFILPINGEIILLRTLRMIREAKASKRIIISTRQEFADQIRSLVGEINFDDLDIEVMVNEGHSKSVVDALMTLPKIKPDLEKFVLVLSDIYFIDNPFFDLTNDGSIGDVLFGSAPISKLELKRGGIIQRTETGEICAIVKQPSDQINHGVRWSGMAICGRHFWEEVSNKIAGKELTRISLEDLFQSRVSNRKTTVRDDIDFVNINSLKHYKLANVVALGKDKSVSKEIRDWALMAAEGLRDELLQKGQQI